MTGFEHPACGRGLNAFAFLVWEGRSVLLQGRAYAVFKGCIDAQTHRHHHQEGPNALGRFAREGGGQKWWGYEDAKPAFRLGWPFVAIEHGLGG